MDGIYIEFPPRHKHHTECVVSLSDFKQRDYGTNKHDTVLRA
jgi:hypothetical protein